MIESQSEWWLSGTYGLVDRRRACSGREGGRQSTPSQSSVSDPGVRAGNVQVGAPLPGLSAAELQFFQDGMTRFMEVDSVRGKRLGRNGPGIRGRPSTRIAAQVATRSRRSAASSPSASQYPNIGPNPQMTVANDAGATNSIPYFMSTDGPVREVRFPYVVSNGRVTSTPDGGVHDVFTIAGRSDAPNCNMPQPNFDQMNQLNNIIFRIPTPLFGGGLDRKHSRFDRFLRT